MICMHSCSRQRIVWFFWLKNWLQKCYFVASNLPVGLEEKVKLLEEDITDRRLRMEWRIVSQMNYLACNNCGDIKCEVSDLINLSVEANGTHFVNPSGMVHDLFTVGRINNAAVRGHPSNEFSWFPGYAWTVVVCSNHECNSHLGWKFTSQKLLPRRFYGISRRSFRLSKADGNNSP